MALRAGERRAISHALCFGPFRLCPDGIPPRKLPAQSLAVPALVRLADASRPPHGTIHPGFSPAPPAPHRECLDPEDRRTCAHEDLAQLSQRRRRPTDLARHPGGSGRRDGIRSRASSVWRGRLTRGFSQTTVALVALPAHAHGLAVVIPSPGLY